MTFAKNALNLLRNGLSKEYRKVIDLVKGGDCMEWWQLLIVLFVGGLIIEDIVSIIAKTIVIKNAKKDDDKQT